MTATVTAVRNPDERTTRYAVNIDGIELARCVTRELADDLADRSSRALREQLGLSQAGNRLARTYSGGDALAPRPGREPRRRAPGCCFSTSRPPAWTRAAAASCGTSSARSWRLGTVVLLTTQYLNEADHLANHIVIIHHGRVVASGSPAQLKRRLGGQVLDVHLRDATTSIGWGDRGSSAQHQRPAGACAPTRRVSVAVDDGVEQLMTALRATRQPASRSTTSPCAPPTWHDGPRTPARLRTDKEENR